MRYDRLAVILTLFLLAMFAIATWPEPVAPGHVAGEVKPDGYDYAYGAQALLQGSYTVDWDTIPHTPRYPPGMSLLLTPSVALGGVESAVWTCYLLTLALGTLTALLAWHFGGPLAAPLAALFSLFALGPLNISGIVMSDLPSATITLAMLALLVFHRGPLWLVLAGLISGYLVWIRYPNVYVILAGLVALTVLPSWRRSILWYLVGVTPMLTLLGMWQFITFGSPLATGYAFLPDNDIYSLHFSPAHLLYSPSRDNLNLGGIATVLPLPSIVVYSLQMVGLDGFLCLPGVGLVGLIQLIRWVRQPGQLGILGRFSLTIILATLGIYASYGYLSGRFLFPSAAVLSTGAAIWLGQRLTNPGNTTPASQ